MNTAINQHLTVPQIVCLTGAPLWAVRRAVDALDPPVPRAGLYRLIPPERLEEVRAALRQRGYGAAGGPTDAA